MWNRTSRYVLRSNRRDTLRIYFIHTSIEVGLPLIGRDGERKNSKISALKTNLSGPKLSECVRGGAVTNPAHT